MGLTPSGGGAILPAGQRAARERAPGRETCAGRGRNRLRGPQRSGLRPKGSPRARGRHHGPVAETWLSLDAAGNYNSARPVDTIQSQAKTLMWKKNRGLWTFSDATCRIADRPHWIAITIGVFSPALALAAIYISYQALNTSERSLKVGSRAYVAVLGGELRFSNFGIVYENNVGIGGHCIVRMELSTTFQNAGSTPASGGTFSAKYRLPKGWSAAPAWVKKNLGSATIGMIGPRATLNWTYTQLFELSPDIYDAFRNRPTQKHLVYVDATLAYKDVFDEKSTIRWCWAAATSESRTATTDCESALRLALDQNDPL